VWLRFAGVRSPPADLVPEHVAEALAQEVTQVQATAHGGATVQETIAARCPMVINHVVSGQEEGNAQLIVETSSGAIALSNDEVVAAVERAFTENAKQWTEWSANIWKLSRPRASLDIAEFLLSI